MSSFPRVAVPLAGLLLLAATTVEAQSLKHRYSFDADVSDSINGADGTVVDEGFDPNHEFSGGQIDLSANTGEGSNDIIEDAYVDLPNGLISEAATTGTEGAISLEWWATVAEQRTWQRFGDFGTSNEGEDTASGGQSSDYILVTPNSGRFGNGLEVTNHPSSNASEPNVGVNGPFPIDEEQHVVAVYDHTDKSEGENGTMRLYLNGAFQGANQIHPDLDLPTMDDNNNWLGRSQWPDPVFDGSFNEFRVYDEALNDEQVIVSAVGGPDSIPDGGTAKIGGPGELKTFTLAGSIENQVFSEPGGELRSGLGQSWYAVGNPGSKAGVDAVAAANERAVPYFQSASEMTWWSGSDTIPDVQNYPEEVDGVITGDNYTVILQGEILIEESGTIRFLDGVDDYTYLAIDMDGNGTAGDSDGEVLIDDNSWTNALSVANGGGELVEANFENIAGDGEWRAIEFNMAEGGGGDHGMLYWDVMDEDDFFPSEKGEGILDLDAFVFMIPDTHLRSFEIPSELESGEFIGSLPAVETGWEIDVNVADGTADGFRLANPDSDIYTSILNVDGVEFHINPSGEVTDGASFKILDADTIMGTPTIATDGWSFDAATGSVVFGGAGGGTSCEDLAASRIPGDADGSGDVGFLDFLALANNFGTEAGYEGGNFDCTGTVSFLDFLTLANNFGSAAAVASSPVPEPSGWALLGIGAMLTGLIRRRR